MVQKVEFNKIFLHLCGNLYRYALRGIDNNEQNNALQSVDAAKSSSG